jgi:hypothetical protein
MPGDPQKTCRLPPKLIYVFAWLLFAAALLYPALLHQREVLAYPHIALALGPEDPDDWVFLDQTRQWLTEGAQGLFDHGVHRTNAPYGGISIHWTRPMQALLALGYFLAPANLSTNVRLMLGATWLAPLLGMAAAAALAFASWRRFRHSSALIAPLLLAVFSRCFDGNFEPGDSDHHGLLCMLWCFAVAIIVDAELDTGMALFVGCLLGLMTWISLQGLVTSALVLGLLGAEALFRPERARLLAAAALGAAAIVTEGLFIEMPPAMVPHAILYDTLSIVHDVLFWLVAAGAIMLAVVLPRLKSLTARTITAAATAATIAGVEFLFYPGLVSQVLTGASLTEFSSGFHAAIIEDQPLFARPREVFTAHLAQPLLAAMLLALGLTAKKLRPLRRHQSALLATLLLPLFAATVWQIRWTYYLQPVAILAIGLLLPGFAAAARRTWLRFFPRNWRVYAVLGLLFYADSVAAMHPAAPADAGAGVCLDQVRYVLQTQQLPQLLGSGNANLFLPVDTGGDALFFTSYSIIASNFHREIAGLQAMESIATGGTENAVRPLLLQRKIGALLYCPGMLPSQAWLRTIAKSHNYPAWLTPIPGLRFEKIIGPKPILLRIKDVAVNRPASWPKPSSSH